MQRSYFINRNEREITKKLLPRRRHVKFANLFHLIANWGGSMCDTEMKIVFMCDTQNTRYIRNTCVSVCVFALISSSTTPTHRHRQMSYASWHSRAIKWMVGNCELNSWFGAQSTSLSLTHYAILSRERITSTTTTPSPHSIPSPLDTDNHKRPDPNWYEKSSSFRFSIRFENPQIDATAHFVRSRIEKARREHHRERETRICRRQRRHNGTNNKKYLNIILLWLTLTVA